MPRRTALTRRPASATAASLAAAAHRQAVTEGQDNTGATARTGIFTTGNSQWTVLPAAGQESLHHGGAPRLGQTLQLHPERSATPYQHTCSEGKNIARPAAYADVAAIA